MNKPDITISEDIPPSISFDAKEFAEQVSKEKSIIDGSIDINFVSTDTIVELNENYLNKNYVTDIITFNLGSTETPIGDIYICCDKAKENATTFNNPYDKEIKLLIIHGILHILDYRDYSEEEKETMNTEQNRILELLCE
jgi:probable rRNA maturation factor